MKNYLKIAIIMLTWAMFSQKANAQDRDVIWVHGYNDDANFWQGYSNMFATERQMNSNNRDYATINANGVPEMANQINIGNANNTVLVGHSMGGVAAAEADNGVRGIITVGAPMDGAAIANAVANGSVEGEIRYAIRQLTAGPKFQFSLAYGIVGLFTGELLGRILEEVLVKIINLDSYSSDEAFTDLQEESAYMNQANRYRAATPKISMWGNENSPVHYRLASSVKSNGANDTEIVHIVNTATGVYLTFQRTNEALGIVNAFGFLFNPFISGPKAAYHFIVASQWKRGKDYLNNSERTWKNLIKSTRTETTTYQVYGMTCSAGQSQVDLIANGLFGYNLFGLGYTGSNCFGWVTQTATNYVMEPSDGFIHQSSQQGVGALNWNPTTVEARGVNHMEMGTHPLTEDILREAWDGQHFGNNTATSPFRIPRR